MDLKAIHQTKIWAEFRKKAKNEPYFEINGAIIQKISLPFGKSWYYCNKCEVSVGLINELRKHVAKDNAVFARFEPPYEKNNKEYEDVTKGFRPAHAHYQPEATLIIDLTQTDEQILAQMKPKGRYNIKIAEKKGVKVKESHDASKFYEILKETTTRDKFSGHGEKYYQEMIDILGKEKMAKLYIAEYEGEVIAGIIATFFNDTATYYYGASSNKHRNLMAPYLLQWHAIREAKERGFKYYDFLGIAPPGARNHPWQGVTEFKLKFGGRVVEYAKAKELVFKPFWYWTIRATKTAMKAIAKTLRK